MATAVELAIAWAKRQIGTTRYKGMCQAFVADAYHLGAGQPRRSASTANAACNLWRVSTSRQGIPKGAAVYFTSPTAPAAGHVGLHIGNDLVIHAFGKVKQMTVSSIVACGYKYKGWGWNGGVQPSGAGIAAGTAAGSSSGYSSYAGAAAEISRAAAAAVIHIPQVEKLYTVYETDIQGKPVDDYALTWQSIRTGDIRDISRVAADLTLEDDAESLCRELTFSLLPATDSRFVPLTDVACGDLIAVTNHGSGECVFLGQVQSTEGTARDAVEVRCLDGGRLLTTNEVICQFDNVPAKTAIETAAAKAGITQVSCPNLVSSVYNIYKASAGDIIQSILEQVTAENGVNYFPRVMGDTLVIRSYGAEPITAYGRQADNLACFDIFDQPGALRAETSIADLVNCVTVYSETDSAVRVLSTEEDPESIRLYGRRQALETWSDQDTASAAAKAKTTLANRNRAAEEIRLTVYGSDRVVAGCRLRPDLEELKGEFWVLSAVHHLGIPHLMDLTLQRAT